METGGPGFNSHATSSQVMDSEDNAFWSGSGSFNDPLIESPQPTMRTAERRKRQNCGNLLYGRPQSVFGGTGQAGLGSNLTAAAEGNVSHYHGPMFSAQGGMSPGNRQQTRNFRSGDSEAGSSIFTGLSIGFGRFVDEPGRNALSPGSNGGVNVNPPFANSRDSFHPYMSDESRNSYKRKSSMDGSADALASRNLSGQRDSDVGWCAPVSGTRRLESSINQAHGDPQLTWDSHNSFQSSRTSAMPSEMSNTYDGLNAFWTPENYRSPFIIGGVPSQALMPRRMPTTSLGAAGNMGVGLPEVLSFREDNGFSGFGTWASNNTFGEQAYDFSGIVHEGTRTRSSLREVVGRSQIDSRTPQHPIRTSGQVHSREFNSQAFHMSHLNPFGLGGSADTQPPAIFMASGRINNVLTTHGGMLRFPPPGSAAALNNPMSAHEALYGDAYPSFANTLGRTPLPRFNHINRMSYMHQVSLHGQRAAPLEGNNRHHRFAASHDFFNQSLIYNGGDWAAAYDQHSDMRLDIDSMSYEELLALEERIGNVSTGLSEESVDKCLKTSILSCCEITSGGKSEESDLKCSICQEEYSEGDELGQLDCGHGYHTACIKQWLMLKNLCPICKAGAGSKA